MKQLDTLSDALIHLKDDSQDYNIVVEREADSLEKLSMDMTKLREDYSQTQIVELITVSKKLLRMTVQEQSLSLSLKQLELEQASETAPASS